MLSLPAVTKTLFTFWRVPFFDMDTHSTFYRSCAVMLLMQWGFYTNKHNKMSKFSYTLVLSLSFVLLSFTIEESSLLKVPSAQTNQGLAAQYFFQLKGNVRNLLIANLDLPGVCESPSPPPSFVFATEICNNNIDDDGDGLIDANDPDCGADIMQAVPVGSFIINMSVQPQTAANAIKPYGLVWYLLHEHNIPIIWSINSTKPKDGVDFTYDGVDYRGGPFIISAEYRTPEVDALIAAWQAQGVVGVTTTSDVTVPVNRVLNYSMNWTLNTDNGQIAQAYLDRAGIPETAYNWTLPQDLDCCTDVFLMPHSEPVWATHNRLLSWNASPALGGCAGSLWAGCKAGSSVENIVNPANPAQRLNFLMLNPVAPATTPAVEAGDHDDGTLPYSYGFPTHPVMQFLGTLDGAQENGAEQIYLPTNGWRPTTFVGAWDADHPDVPSLSPGKAAKLAFGPAFGDATRGYIMYQTGHRQDRDDNPENIASQRAFFNFSFLAVGQKAIHATATIPDIMESGTDYPLSATASGGSGAYHFHWETDCGGSFSNPYSATTTYSPPDVLTTSECYIKVMVTDDCGTRVGFQNVFISMRPRPAPPVAVDDYEETLPGSPVTVNALVNDSDPNMDPLTLTSLLGPTNTGNGVFANNGDGTVTYTPDFDFVGIDQIRYSICDNTPPAKGGSLCDTATIFITVDWSDANGCYPNQYYGIAAQGNATTVLAQNSISNPTQALGAPVLVAGNGNYYAKIDNNTDYLVLDLGYNVPVGDTIWLHIGSDDGASATLNVQGTLSSSNYINGNGFYDLKSYTTIKDLNNAAPQEDIVAYVPATGAVRKLRFTRATGANKPCVNAVHYVDLNCLSAVPVANDDAVTICEDHSTYIDVLFNDSDPQDLPLSVSILSQPLHGEISLQQDRTFKYQPDHDYSGTDNFNYQICNSKGLCDQAVVSITITDDGCLAGQTTQFGGSSHSVADNFPANAYTNNTGSQNWSNIWTEEGDDGLAGSGDIRATGGLVECAVDGSFAIYRGANLSSTNSAILSFTVNDHNLNGDDVYAVEFSNNGGTSYSILKLFNDSSPASSAESFDLKASFGTLGSDARVRFRRHSGSGGEKFKFDNVQIQYELAGCFGPCVPIPTYPPDAINDYGLTYINTPISIAVQSNDVDPSSLGLTTFLGVSNPPDNGSIELVGKQIKYTPNTGFIGQDVFNYKICNPYGCDSALVTVDVLCVNPEDGRAIQGMVFDDLNMNGALNNGDAGVANIRVRLFKDLNANGVVNPGESKLDSALTDAYGNYVFKLGNGVVVNSSSVTNYATSATGSVNNDYPLSYATGAPNGNFVKMGSSDYVVLGFANTIPFGTNVTINLASDKSSGSASISGSPDGITFSNAVTWSPGYSNDQGNPPPASAFLAFNYQVTATNGIKYVKIARTGNNIYADAAAYKQIVQTGGESSVSLTRIVNSSTDDAEEEGPDGSNLGPGGMYLTSSDLEMTQDIQTPSSGNQKIGLRFNTINIPQGATIKEATLSFRAVQADSPNSNNGPTALTIKGQATDNAPTFTTSVNNISNRALTTASTLWNPSVWLSNQTYTTPDIKAVVQEIVNRPSWADGNSMVFVISGSGSRSADSFNGSPSGAPVLKITYTTGSGADNGHFVIQLSTASLPPNSTLTTDNIETAVVLNNGDVDCSNNFGLINHRPPIANPDTAYVSAGTTVVINNTINDYDPEGTPLTMTFLTNPPFGTAVNLGNGTLKFTSNNGFTGWQTFLYKVCDQGTPTLCDTTTVSVLVSPLINNRPVAQDDYDTIVVNIHVETDVLDNDFDQENDNLTTTLTPGIQQPANGTVTVVNGKIVEYMPNPGFTGNDVYQYIVCDNRSPSLCDTARVFIHVKNQPPDARWDYAETQMNIAKAISVLVNDIEPDGHAIILMSTGTNATPSNGLTVKGGTVSVSTNGTAGNYADDFINYTPPAGFICLDTFQYRVRDSGTPNMYDITYVVVRVSGLIDLELTKTVNPSSTQIGQNVTFTLTLLNKGPAPATTVLTKDKLTSSYQYVSDNGAGAYDPVSGVWFVPAIAVNQTRTLTITAKILNNAQLKNITEVIAADQVDVDSRPNNDDGDQSEDDEDAATPVLGEICTNGVDDDGDGLVDCADSGCGGAPAVNAGGNGTICTGGSFTLNATANGSGDGCFKVEPPASGSMNGITYIVNGDHLTVAGTGIVSVEVKGGTESVIYTTPPFTNLTAPINPDNGQPYGISHFTICTSGGGAGGTSPYTFTWNNGLGSGASKTVTPAATTIYIVTVTSATGCTSTGQAMVTVVADPAITAQPTSITLCSNSAHTLSVTATGGTPSLAYQWEVSPNGSGSWSAIGGATSSSYTTPVLAATSYYRVLVSAAGSGCGSVTSSVATVTVGTVTANAGADVTLCGGLSTTLTATGGNSYNWSNGLGSGASKAVTPASTTTYTVTVTNASGCTGTDQVVVTVNASPTASVTPNQTICSGTITTLTVTASGGISPFIYAWSNGLGAGASKTVTPASSTTYTVTVTGSNGCTSTVQTSVGVNATPTANAGADATICNGVSTTLTASGSGAPSPYTYLWSNGALTASQSVSPAATTTYTVSVTSANGCFATDQKVVLVLPCIEICNNGLDDDGDGLADCADSDCGPSANAGTDISICPGNTALLSVGVTGGSAPYIYTWNNGIGTGAIKTVTPLVSTTYTVTVTSASGCTTTDQVVVTVNTCTEDCTNGIDDDGDGLVDCDDPDCSGITAPVLVDDAYTTCPGMVYSNRVTYNDGNLNNPAFSISVEPQHGVVSIDWTGKFIYTPNSFECVTDQFTYQVCNQSSGCCDEAVVTIIMGDNTLPILTNVPADLSISCDDAVPAAQVVTAFDQCPGIYMDYDETSSQNYVGACGSFTITRTWTATDFCGNTVSDDQKITVLDQTKPEIFQVYTMDGGAKMVAGFAERVTHEWKYVRFPITFHTAPVVLATISTNADAIPVVVNVRNATLQGFEMRLREEEAQDGIHGLEKVSWVAIEPSTQNGNLKWEAGTFANVNQNLDALAFSQNYDSAPIFLSSFMTSSQADPATLRHTNLSGTGVELFAQEEQSADAEVGRLNENIGYLAINENEALVDNDGNVFGETGKLNITNAWATVNLSQKYTKPVVIIGGLTNLDGEPVTISVRNVASNKLEVRLKEWNYLDGSHPAEGVSWMVVEGSVSANRSFYCSGDAALLKPNINVFAVDNCDDLVAFGMNESSGQEASGLVSSLTWTAIDDCGNTTLISRNDTCQVAAVQVKAMLFGAMVNNGGGNLMRDNLRTQDLVPLLEPYSEMPNYPYVENLHPTVTICHNSGQADQETLTIPASELQAHLDLGDIVGACVTLPYTLPPAAAAATYRTIADGVWTDAATWQSGSIPPVGNVSNKQISIEHHVTLPTGDLNLQNGTKLWVTNGGLTVSNGNVKLQASSFLANNSAIDVTNGFFYTWTGQCRVEMKDCIVYVGDKFSHESGTSRLENVCLEVRNDMTCSYASVNDTLINVTATVGGAFRNYNSGKIYISNSSFRLTNGDFSNEVSSTISGNGLVLLLENGNVSNLGTWTVAVSQYCISGIQTIPVPYLPALANCANITYLFASCKAGESNAVGSSGSSGGSNNGGSGDAAFSASIGVMEPTMLDVAGEQAIVDWLLLELRNYENEADVLGYATVVMKRNGEVVSENGDSIIVFTGLPEGDYYVAIRHRNHLGQMTDTPVFLSVIDPPFVDFTNIDMPIRGGNGAGRVNSYGKRTLWGGDYNGDGKIIYQGPYNDVFNLFSRVVGDVNNSTNLANFIVPGYEMQDFNLDGKVIYQGPNNDRSHLLIHSILAHAGNGSLLANYIVLDFIP